MDVDMYGHCVPALLDFELLLHNFCTHMITVQLVHVVIVVNSKSSALYQSSCTTSSVSK